MFGNTFLESIEGGVAEEGGMKSKPTRSEKATLRKSIKTGVVQFGGGLSIAPIEVARMTMTNKSGVEKDKDRGMAPLAFRVVRHGVYVMPFFVNPNAAHKTGCAASDIQLLLRLIPYAYELNRANNRTEVYIRHAWYAEHTHPLGSCSDFEVFRSLTPSKKAEPHRASISWDEYMVPKALPQDLAARVKPLRDLVEEAHAAVRP